jgi:TonB-linked SusC/RagA family outer membrane protein
MKRIYAFLILMCLIISHINAQTDITITGKVTDSDNNPIQSVTIRTFPGNKAVGSTNAKGQFSVKVPVGAKSLEFSNMSYKSKTVTIGDKRLINISLVPSENEIETVEIAYTARKAETLTGTMTVVKGKDIKETPAASFTDLLQGRVAGLNIQQNTGTPGVRGSISIRGLNSSTINISEDGNTAYMSSTSPLFVIDGVPIEDNEFQYGLQTSGPGISPISMIPVEEIEEIVVLKDAQATSMYGSKGAYGVILVTTKRGNSNIPQIYYSNKQYLSTIPTLRPVIGGAEENRIRTQLILNNDTALHSALKMINNLDFLSDSLNVYYNNSTSWYDYFYANTLNTEQSLNISGGTNKFNYKISPSYFNQLGIIRNTSFKRYNLSTNFGYFPTSKFQVNSYLQASIAKSSTGTGNAFSQTGVAGSINTSSLLPGPSIYTGAIDALRTASVANDNKTGYFNSHLEIAYQLFAGVRLRTFGSFQFNLSTKDEYTQELLNGGRNKVFIYDDNKYNLYWRNQLNIDKALFGNEKHKINVNFFQELTKSSYRPQGMQFEGLGSDQIQVGLYGSGFGKGGYYDRIEDFRSFNFATSLAYSYDNKYVWEVSYRQDGSSNSAAKDPWTKYPTSGIRWNFMKEEFLKNPIISDGSVRLSWGRNVYPQGNIFDIYGRYELQGTYNEQSVISLNRDRIPNDELQPIVQTQWNLGVSINLFNNKMGLNYDTYYKEIKNELVGIELPNTSGFGSIIQNERAFINRGHELSTWINPKLNTKIFSFGFWGNISYNRDAQARLEYDRRQQMVAWNGNRMLQRIGRNSFSHVLFHHRGVYKSDEEVPINPLTGLRYRVGNNQDEDYFFRKGDPIFTDVNGDYILDDEDLVIVGNSRPLFYGGFGINIWIGKFTITPNFSYTLKRDIINSSIAESFRNYYKPGDGNALFPLTNNFFSDENLDSPYPYPLDFRRAEKVGKFRTNSTLFMEDGSYLKFNSISLGYNVPDDSKLLRMARLRHCRFYVNLSNIHTFSRYSGPDPELVDDLGYDYSYWYPRSRNWNFSLEINF